MTTPIRAPGAPIAAPAPDRAERLRGVARQLEGVFVEQMYKAMRETVPEGGAVDGGSGEAMFSGMLDQHLATLTPERWDERGLAAAVYRQLRVPAGVEESGQQASGIGDQATAPDARSPMPDASSPTAPLPILGAAPRTTVAPTEPL